MESAPNDPISPLWRKQQPQRLAEFLREAAAHFDPALQMVAAPAYQASRSSHSQEGATVHPLRHSYAYVQALLLTGSAADGELAAAILRRLVRFQDTDPTSWTFGVSDRQYLEEPWAHPPYAPWYSNQWSGGRSQPDWNYADFTGLHLARILRKHESRLPGDLVQLVRTGLGNAAWSVFRRNVGSDYTNIAVYGAAVALTAGELLGEPRLVEYGRRRLRNLIESYRWHGQFNEYNSPTYGPFALVACEDILDLAIDAAARADTEEIRRLLWQSLAEHFHPGTGQLAGPQFRAYADVWHEWAVDYLRMATGLELEPQTVGHRLRLEEFRNYRLCPAEWVDRFRRLPEREVVLRQRLIRREKDEQSTYGTTWLAQDVTLGSVTQEGMSDQRRPVLGYWRVGEGGTAILRLRALQDGRDRGVFWGYHAQERHRILSAVSCVIGSPEDPPVVASDLCIRYELAAPGGAVRALGEGVFELSAGAYRAVVHTAPGQFGEKTVVWSMGQSGDRVYVEAVWHRGAQQTWDFSAVAPLICTAGLEVLGLEEAPVASRPQIGRDDSGFYRSTWRTGKSELCLRVPVRAVRFYAADGFPNRATMSPKIPY